MRHVSVIILCGPGGNNRVLDEMKGTTTSLGTVNSLEEVMGKRRMHGHALEAALCTWDRQHMVRMAQGIVAGCCYDVCFLAKISREQS